MACRYVVIWNEFSRSGQASQELHNQLTQSSEIQLFSAKETERYEDYLNQPQACEAVIIGGGDGTIHKVVNSLLKHNLHYPLGILPLGTGNDFCRSLHFPTSPEAVLQCYLNSEFTLKPVDAMEFQLDDQTIYSMNLLAAGVSAEFSQQLSSEDKELLGSFAYLKGALTLFTTPKLYEIDLKLDGLASVQRKCLNFFVANGRMCGGGIEVAPTSQLDDQQLQFILYQSMTGVDRAILLTDYLVGHYEDHEAVEIHTISQLELTAKSEIPLSIDGEIYTGTHLKARVLPHRLSILMPKNANSLLGTF